jgi:hypothetical protein
MVYEQDFLTACIDQKWCVIYLFTGGDFSDYLLRLDTTLLISFKNHNVDLRRFISLRILELFSLLEILICTIDKSFKNPCH